MKKLTQWVLAATLTFCGAMMMLTSCTDAIGTADNPVNPNPPYDPADELAKETFLHEEWMDRSVKPGDSFWNFALGSWLKNHNKGDEGCMLNAYTNKMQLMLEDMLENASDHHTIQLVTSTKLTKEEEKAAMARVYAQLKQGDDISKADVMYNIGKMADMGFCALMGHDLLNIGGVLRYYIMPGLACTTIDLKKPREEEMQRFKTFFKEWLDIDTSTPEGAQLFSNVYDLEEWISKYLLEWKGAEPKPSLIGNRRPELKSDPVPAMETLAKTRGTTKAGDDVMDAFREAFHIDNGTYYLPETDKVFEQIDQYDVATLQTYLKFYVYYKLYSMSFAILEQPQTVIVGLDTNAPSMFLKYHKKFLLQDADCEGGLQMLEQLRKVMSERIANLDWLSDATKMKAQEKLQAMVFNVGAPEDLFNADFKLTGQTHFEDFVQYKEQADDYMRNQLAGKPGNQYGWEYIMLSPMGAGIDAMNAFYESTSNQLFILPLFLGSDIFPADKPAIRYATMTVFAHEMTHGFDNKGATYDAMGSKVDWWAADDKAKFLEKQQQMINRYNELEQYPGVQADGKKTLGENIADLGGFSLAYQLWNEKLQADGLTGEALRHQQRQFFMSFADLWQNYFNEETLQKQLEVDVHSANPNRVNGIVRLMDDWYTLFGVQPGDKLYVKPEDRVKIW